MKQIFSNKYIQSILVFVVIVGGYIAYKNVEQYYTLQNTQLPQEEITSLPDVAPPMDTEMNMGDNSVDTEVSDGSTTTIDYSGTHIMPNGDVMMKNGEVLPDAEILPDDTIQLGNGEIITPMMDLRK
jgi:hypothetical protein